MDPSTVAISLGMLGLGFVSGFSVASVVSQLCIDKLNRALQKSIELKFEDDKRFERLSKEYAKIVDKYETLRNSTSQFIRSLTGLDSLPPPDASIERQECCADDDSESDISIPETPTDLKEKTD